MKLEENELARIKELRWSGKSWDAVQADLVGRGVMVKRNNLIAHCQRIGMKPKPGGGFEYESWCAPKSSMKKSARRMRAYRARKRDERLGVSDAKGERGVMPSLLNGRVAAHDHSPDRPRHGESRVTQTTQLLSPSSQGSGHVVAVPAVELTPPVRASSSLPAVEEIFAVKTIEATKETVPVGAGGLVVHMPVSMPEKEVNEIPGSPAGHNTSEPVTPPGTAPTPIPHGTVPADEPLGEPIPGRQGWVRGVDGVVRRETVRERKVRMLEVARKAQAEEAQKEREKVEQAERDRLDQLARDARYEKARQERWGSLWGTKSLPVTEPKPGEPEEAGH